MSIPNETFDDGPTLAEEQERAAKDVLLQAAIGQGYVPKTCLLAGVVVMAATQMDGDACAGCNIEREKCHGRPKRVR